MPYNFNHFFTISLISPQFYLSLFDSCIIQFYSRGPQLGEFYLGAINGDLLTHSNLLLFF